VIAPVDRPAEPAGMIRRRRVSARDPLDAGRYGGVA
jgi:hypothetical protein